ncbi:hypothetical protein [Mycolicibacterium sp.]|uniref:hypothetical protein n=1 Tax=Mycolicibacterium sp. TaxID=2320850 RepID=UPI003D0E08F2
MSGPRLATRRLLSRQVSAGAVIELSLWLAIPYLLIGLGWTVFHPEQVRRIDVLLQDWLPAGAELAGYLVVTALWPVYLLVPSVCAA